MSRNPLKAQKLETIIYKQETFKNKCPGNYVTKKLPKVSLSSFCVGCLLLKHGLYTQWDSIRENLIFHFWAVISWISLLVKNACVHFYSEHWNPIRPCVCCCSLSELCALVLLCLEGFASLVPSIIYNFSVSIQ